MKGRILNIVLVLVLATLPMAANAGWSEAQQVTGQTPPAPAQVEEMPAPDADFNSSPVMFIENVGQWDDGARFQVWGGPAGTMWLAEDAIWITVVEPGETSRQVDRGPDPALWRPSEDQENLAPRRGVNIKIGFVGANPQPRIETFDRLDTTVSYFYGNDPDQWRADVPVWGGMRYVDLYPGVDLELASAEGQMALRVAAWPDADLGAVALRVEGAETVTLDGSLLRLSTAVGAVALPLLQAEGAPGDRAQVQPSGDGAFEVVAPFAPLSASSPPTPQRSPTAPTDNPGDLLYGTFLGGTGDDSGQAVTLDGIGNIYVTGGTGSADFPVTPGAFDLSLGGHYDVFVVKLNSIGSELVYATFLGGNEYFGDFGIDTGYAIALDEANNAYVTGLAIAVDFPTTPGAFDTIYDGHDAFATKLNPTGSELMYSTFLGGSELDYGKAIAVDTLHHAYVTGYTFSYDFPTTPNAYDTSYDMDDAFLVKLNPTGSGLIFATFLGGGDSDFGWAIKVDESFRPYVTGWTLSTDFYTTPHAFDTSHNGGEDVFVVQLDASGSALVYATLLGGGGDDRGTGIAIDNSGDVHVAGYTSSDNFPTTTGAFDTGFNGGPYDAFFAVLDTTGNSLSYASYLGGSDLDQAWDLTVDEEGNAYIIGITRSNDFPTTLGAFDTSHNGGDDAFVVKLNPNGSGLGYATFLGGSITDGGSAVIVDGLENHTYVVGFTASSDFPITPDAFDPICGDGDTFIAKLDLSDSQHCCDLNGDGVVNVHDIIMIANLWGQQASVPFDQDGDGWVTLVDIQRVARWWEVVAI